MAGEPLVSVIVPSLNEAGNVGALLRRLQRAMGELPYEVVLVDDGSTDGTVAEARGAPGSLQVVRREHERGLGTAVVRGLAEARGAYAVVMDADLQHPPEAVPDLVARAQETGAELVVGSRYVPGGEDPGFGPVRRGLSRLAHLAARTTVPAVRRHGLTDATSGFFLVERDAVDPGALSPKGYKVLLEVLARTEMDRVEEVGYTFHPREDGESKLSAAVLLAFLWHLALLFWSNRENRRIVQFGAVGALGVVVNMGLLFGLTEGVGLHYVVSAVIAVEASILHNFYLNDVYTFRDLRHGRQLVRLARFNFVSLVSLLVNLSVLVLLTESVGLHYLVSEAAAIAVAFALNYAGNRSWTYLAPGTPPTHRGTGPGMEAGARLRAWLGWGS